MAEVLQNTQAALPEEPFASEDHPVSVHKEFTFPGNLDSLVSSREQVMDFIREHGCDEADEIDLMIALQEALANAALHGCGNDAGKSISCVVEIEPTGVSIVVRDPGPGFDVQKIADPDRFHTTTLEHGRGIALMRGMVDEVRFARGGSEVRLLKRMSCVAFSGLHDTDAPSGW